MSLHSSRIGLKGISIDYAFSLARVKKQNTKKIETDNSSFHSIINDFTVLFIRIPFAILKTIILVL